MSRYRRARVAGATYFFTVNTDRRQPILTHTCALSGLRQAVRTVKHRLPFRLDARVVLPDHWHMVITLPPDDGDYSARLSRIKRHVAQSARPLITEPQTLSRVKSRERGFGQRRFWEHQIRGFWIDRIPRFTAMCGVGFIRRLGGRRSAGTREMKPNRSPRAHGAPCVRWIPAFAGMTALGRFSHVICGTVHLFNLHVPWEYVSG